MASYASEALGSPQVAGSFVSPTGLTKKLTAGAAGTVVGGAAGSMAAHMATGGMQYEGAPEFGTVGYVAVTADELAIVKGKTAEQVVSALRGTTG